MYQHRQSGGIALIALLLPAAICALLAWQSHAWWLYLLAFIFLVIAWLFSSLNIEVNDRELVSYFGPGFWRKRVPLADIVEARRTTSSVLEGWGIRVTMRGMLYNVAGLDAVELRLANGSHVRFGTDDVDGLTLAVQSRIRQRAVS